MDVGHFFNYRGIDIIPSEDIPNGYKRTTEKAIYVSSGNYELLRPLSAKGTILMLGLLKEIKLPVGPDEN